MFVCVWMCVCHAIDELSCPRVASARYTAHVLMSHVLSSQGHPVVRYGSDFVRAPIVGWLDYELGRN